MQRLSSVPHVGICAQATRDGRLHIDFNDDPVDLEYGEPHLRLEFPLHTQFEQRQALKCLRSILIANEVDWLTSGVYGWRLDFDLLGRALPHLTTLPWMKGAVRVEPEVFTTDRSSLAGSLRNTTVRFLVTEDEVQLQGSRRVFLSHKGIDKPRVRPFAEALRTVGFDPWLDEDAMAAGVELERGLLQGMKDSCAAVFFITPRFEDAGFPATEVNYAMAEKRAKGARFAIISLVLPELGAVRGTVPELLRQFTWKEPASDLEAFRELIRALPLQVAHLDWRA